MPRPEYIIQRRTRFPSPVEEEEQDKQTPFFRLASHTLTLVRGIPIAPFPYSSADPVRKKKRNTETPALSIAPDKLCCSSAPHLAMLPFLNFITW